MATTTQQIAVIDPGASWLLPIPKGSFTMPKFTFGQLAKLRNGDVIGQIIGMEFAASGSPIAAEIGCGWHYTLLGRNFSSGYLQTLVEFVAEADLKRSSAHIFRSLV